MPTSIPVVDSEIPSGRLPLITLYDTDVAGIIGVADNWNSTVELETNAPIFPDGVFQIGCAIIDLSTLTAISFKTASLIFIHSRKFNRGWILSN